MRASYQWLKYLSGVDASADAYATALTRHGLEVEGLSTVDDDKVFEVSLTPNRPDCLGHLGLARELALAFGQNFAPRLDFGFLPDMVARAAATHHNTVAPKVSVKLNEALRCPRYVAQVVRGVHIAPSPAPLAALLLRLGVRPIHNVVDATNWVMLCTGHPTHAFDAGQVAIDSLHVRLAHQDEQLATLDGTTRTLLTDDLVIADKHQALALAGVMGGASSQIEPQTQAVLLECAYFDPRSVRRTARRHGMHTDASHRFERGVDPNDALEVIQVLAQAVIFLAGGQIDAPVDTYPKPIAQSVVPLRAARIAAMLGFSPTEAETAYVLEGLGCLSKDAATWATPTWRPDLLREIDLIEEVARVLGYDRIPTLDPLVKAAPKTLDTASTDPFIKDVKLGQGRVHLRRLREGLASQGLFETVNYAFVSPSDLQRSLVSTDAVVMANPLSEERSVLRTSLLPGLLSNVARAMRHQQTNANLFEIARVFHPHPSQALPEERETLGIVMWGEVDKWPGDPGKNRRVDFFDLKGLLTRLFDGLFGMTLQTPHAVDLPAYLHPNKSALVHLNGQSVGAMGVLHPEVTEAWDITGEVMVALIDLEQALLLFGAQHPNRFVQLPKFPHVTRDVTLSVPDHISTQSLIDVARQAQEATLSEVIVRDVFRGTQTPVGKRDITFRLVYRLLDSTLSDIQVESIHSKILTFLNLHIL